MFVSATVYFSVNIVCGGKITSDKGVIQSPNYPANYPRNSNCTWIISVPHSAMEFTFEDFRLEFDSECRSDSVKVSMDIQYISPAFIFDI